MSPPISTISTIPTRCRSKYFSLAVHLVDLSVGASRTRLEKKSLMGAPLLALIGCVSIQLCTEAIWGLRPPDLQISPAVLIPVLFSVPTHICVAAGEKKSATQEDKFRG